MLSSPQCEHKTLFCSTVASLQRRGNYCWMWVTCSADHMMMLHLFSCLTAETNVLSDCAEQKTTDRTMHLLSPSGVTELFGPHAVC